MNFQLKSGLRAATQIPRETLGAGKNPHYSYEEKDDESPLRTRSQLQPTNLFYLVTSLFLRELKMLVQRQLDIGPAAKPESQNTFQRNQE